MSLDFSNLTLEDLGISPKSIKPKGVSKNPPTEKAFRLNYKGELIPNRNLEPILQYADTKEGNDTKYGIDILTEDTWASIPTPLIDLHRQKNMPILYLLFVPKTASKVDFFTGGRYAGSTPDIYDSTQKDIGKAAFASLREDRVELLPLMEDKDAWTTAVTEGAFTEKEFDIKDITEFFKDVTISITKPITRGAKKGQLESITRVIGEGECKMYQIDLGVVEEEETPEEVPAVETATEANDEGLLDADESMTLPANTANAELEL